MVAPANNEETRKARQAQLDELSRGGAGGTTGQSGQGGSGGSGAALTILASEGAGGTYGEVSGAEGAGNAPTAPSQIGVASEPAQQAPVPPPPAPAAEIEQASRAPTPADLYRPQQGMGGGGMMTPGGWAPHSREYSQVGAVQVPPEVAGQFDAAGLYKARGAIGAAAANTGAARAESENSAQREQIQSQSLQQQERMDRGRAKVVGARRKILEDLSQDIADDKIDPRRFWTEKSTGEKVFLGIMAGIAGIGVGLSGGDNPVLQNIRRNIEVTNQEDLRRAQAKEKKYARQENALTGLMKIFDDERSALTALTSLKLSALEQALLKRKAVARTALERANLDTVIGGIVEENARTKLELEKLEAGKIGEEYKEAYSQPKLIGGGGSREKEPTDEETSAVAKDYFATGMADYEDAIRLGAEALNMKPSVLMQLAIDNPGVLTNYAARMAVKDKKKLQQAAAAGTIGTFKMTGSVAPAGELARTHLGFDTGDPEALANTLGIWARRLKTAEGVHMGGRWNAYSKFAHRRREYEQRMRPSLSPPTTVPEPGQGAR